MFYLKKNLKFIHIITLSVTTKMRDSFGNQTKLIILAKLVNSLVVRLFDPKDSTLYNFYIKL